MPGTNEQWRRVAGLPFQALDDEIIVVNPAQREVYLLNETASRVWELCATPRTVEDLVAGLAEEYEVPEEDLRRALSEVLDGFRDKRVFESL